MDGATSLLWLAATTGLIHTALGPDHYIPFVAMSRAGGWTYRRTMFITVLCGLGHVLGSVILGVLGVGIGVIVGGLDAVKAIESQRGAIAGWLLLGFGIAYTAWEIRRAIRNRPHAHLHVHADGTAHHHPHSHQGDHAHVHASSTSARAATMSAWALFTIFVFGPCEVLIPQLMAPASQGTWGLIAMVTALFAAATIGTMVVAVSLGFYGLGRLRVDGMERYAGTLAGAAVTACGAAMVYGW